MRKRNKLFALCLAFVFALGALAACSTDDAASTGGGTAPSAGGAAAGGDEPLKVYVVSVMSGGAAWGQFERGFLQACEELGWEGHYLSPQNANSTAELVNLCETAITNGADILLPVVTDNDAFADVLQKAKDMGITMVGAAAPDDHLEAYIGTNPINLGYAIAEALATSVPEDEEINVVTMQSLLTNAMQIVQRDAFEERLMELRPDANIVSYEECDSNAAQAQDKVAALYLANPNLNSLISLDSYAGLGAAAFVEERGLQDSFYVVGIDDAPEILRCIENGTMACTVAQMWYNMGYDCVYLAQQVHTGGSYVYENDSGSAIVYAEDMAAWIEQNGIDMSA